MSTPSAGATTRRSVPPLLDLLAGWAWRLLLVAAAGALVLWLVGRLWVVLVPLVVAVFLCRILMAPNLWLRRRGWRPAVAATAVLVAFLLVLVVGATLLGAAIADEVDQIGPTISDAVDDLETWLVEDGPFEVTRAEVEELRADAGHAVRNGLETSGGSLVSGAVLLIEVLLSLLLGLIITFFALKDGERFRNWVRGLFAPSRHVLLDGLARSAWRTLGGYLRGAALLGAIEGLVISVTLLVVGAGLVVPVAAVTFVAAFVPFAGAIAAGAVATLVTLATAGTPEAFIVLAVVVVVQQLDNDLLAPVVYGRALNLHPVLVLLAVAGGGALFGIVGSFFAVPVTAIVVNLAAEARQTAPDGRGAAVDAAGPG